MRRPRKHRKIARKRRRRIRKGDGPAHVVRYSSQRLQPVHRHHRRRHQHCHHHSRPRRASLMTSLASLVPGLTISALSHQRVTEYQLRNSRHRQRQATTTILRDRTKTRKNLKNPTAWLQRMDTFGSPELSVNSYSSWRRL